MHCKSNVREAARSPRGAARLLHWKQGAPERHRRRRAFRRSVVMTACKGAAWAVGSVLTGFVLKAVLAWLATRV